jgi:hypothetical protein
MLPLTLLLTVLLVEGLLLKVPLLSLGCEQPALVRNSAKQLTRQQLLHWLKP